MSTANATVMDHVHGVPNNRCLDPACQIAYIRWSKQYRVDKSRGVQRTVDADRARKVIAKLEGLGWSRRSIAAAAGISATAVSRLMHGQKTIRTPILVALLDIDDQQVPSVPSHNTTEPFVPRRGVVRRVQALLAMGWTHAEMTKRAGVRTSVLLHQEGRWVTRSTHDKIAVLYKQLAGSVGPSERTRLRARHRGYVSPIGWHDIDLDDTPTLEYDPEVDDLQADVDWVTIERVLAGELVPASNAERRIIVARWPETGRPLNDLARLTGWKVERYHPRDQDAA